MIKIKTTLLTMVLSLLLLAGTMAEARAQGRKITADELARFTQVDPDYANNVKVDEAGNYIDNNSDEVYARARVKSEAQQNHEIIDPTLEAQRVNDVMKNKAELPRLRITGDEMFDISGYKEDIKKWVAENPDAVQYLDADTRGLLNAGNYAGLYKKAYTNGYTRKN